MIYLNNAATSWPKPESVLKAVSDCLANPPSDWNRGTGDKSGDILSECRTRAARFFGIGDPVRLVFTSGGTHSLNLAIRGLNLDGAHVVTTVTEHNSVIRPLKHLERDRHVRLTFVKCSSDGTIDPGDVISAMHTDTCLVAVSHMSNVTGAVQDLAAIGEETRQRGIPFLVDASQSAGHVPIDVEAMKIDLLAFTGHKGLRGLPGTGGLYIREGIPLEPLMTGGTGVKSESLHQPEELPLYYEAGTLNLPGIAGLNEGLKLLEDGAMERDEARTAELTRRLTGGLAGIPGIHLIGGRGGILSFTLDGHDPEETGYLLSEMYGISVRTGLHCAPLIHEHIGTSPRGTVRVSPSDRNTEAEMDAFVEAVGKIAGKYKSRLFGE